MILHTIGNLSLHADVKPRDNWTMQIGVKTQRLSIVTIHVIRTKSESLYTPWYASTKRKRQKYLVGLFRGCVSHYNRSGIQRRSAESRSFSIFSTAEYATFPVKVTRQILLYNTQMVIIRA